MLRINDPHSAKTQGLVHSIANKQYYHSAIQRVSLCLCSLLAATSQFSIFIGQKMHLWSCTEFKFIITSYNSHVYQTFRAVKLVQQLADNLNFKGFSFLYTLYRATKVIFYCYTSNAFSVQCSA